MFRGLLQHIEAHDAKLWKLPGNSRPLRSCPPRPRLDIVELHRFSYKTTLRRPSNLRGQRLSKERGVAWLGSSSLVVRSSFAGLGPFLGAGRTAFIWNRARARPAPGSNRSHPLEERPTDPSPEPVFDAPRTHSLILPPKPPEPAPTPASAHPSPLAAWLDALRALSRRLGAAGIPPWDRRPPADDARVIAFFVVHELVEVLDKFAAALRPRGARAPQRTKSVVRSPGRPSSSCASRWEHDGPRGGLATQRRRGARGQGNPHRR